MKKTSFLISLLILLTTDFYGQGFIVAYPQEPNTVLSAKYTVFVNEIPISVYNVGDKRDVSYAHFAFAGKIKVRIHSNLAINTYNLSPHSYGIVSVKSGKDITFELDKPRKLLLKEVNTSNEHLCIFADPLEENNPKIGDSNVINILDKGVDKTGATDNITIIQDAINNLPTHGILYFPPGRYTAGGTLFMKSNRSIYLAGGATLQASPIDQLQITFDGASNARLFGRGSIDARGDIYRNIIQNGPGGIELIKLNKGAVSDNCKIEDLIMKCPVNIVGMVYGTTNWKVYNIKTLGGRQFGRKCWNPDDAVNMMMDNVFLYGTNDNIGFSTFKNNLDLNTTIRNSVFYDGNSGATVRIGPWIGENTKHITVENNDHILGGINEYTLAFYLGGAISGFKYLNNRIENAPHGLLLMRTNWNDFYAGMQSGSAADIVFDRLSVEKVGVGYEGHYSCLESSTSTNFIKNITFKDFYQKGALQTNHTTADMQFVGPYVSNVEYTVSTTPVIDITAADLFAYRTGLVPGKFTVSRSGGSTNNPLNVNYIIHGTAVNGTDYFTIGDSILIPAGSTSSDILIKPGPGHTPDYYRTVFISLSSSNDKYILGPGYHAVVTISNGSTTDIDKEAPTIPVNLTAMAITNSGCNLTWNTSVDNIGIATYQLFKNGIYLATTSDTSYSVTGLTSSTGYEFTVKAWDRSGNSSSLSNVLKVPTLTTAISESYINQLFVYPNPVVDHILLVDFEDVAYGKEANIQIRSIEGRVEFQTTIPVSQRVSINLPQNLANGVYVLSIKTSKESLNQKIVVE